MGDRTSALAGHYHRGMFGKVGQPQVTFQELPNLSLLQVAAWPETINAVEAMLIQAVGCNVGPAPSCVSGGSNGALLRVEPLKWWIVGSTCSIEELTKELSANEAVALDLSHSRCQLQISGTAAEALLNRHLSVDLRADECPVNSLFSTVFHHVGVTLWKSTDGYELLLPRGFAVSLFELLCETAEQFGYEVV